MRAAAEDRARQGLPPENLEARDPQEALRGLAGQLSDLRQRFASLNSGLERDVDNLERQRPGMRRAIFQGPNRLEQLYPRRIRRRMVHQTLRKNNA